MKVLTLPGARSRTADRGPPDDEPRITIHTVEQLGPKRKLLPNGNLLCLDVPVARIGWMMYGPGETPILVGETGVAYIQREADELFNPITLGSIMGAAVTDGHPEDDVTPANWKKLAKGFATTNVRQGTGDDAEVVLADLIIADKGLIEKVLAGLIEVSLGYDSTYLPVAPGVGRQVKIICNHVALVEKGRCGPRCAIGDREFQPPPTVKEKAMPTPRVKIDPTKRVALDELRRQVRDAEAELEEGAGGGDTHIHIHANGEPMADAKGKDAGEEDPNEKRFLALEGGVKTIGDTLAEVLKSINKGEGKDKGKDGKGKDGEPDPDEKDDKDKSKDGKGKDADPDDEDGKKKTDDADPDDEDGDDAKGKDGKGKDSAALETSYAQVLQQAEILVPGFTMPTFDSAAKRAFTVDSMCKARRKCLDAVYATGPGQELLHSVAGPGTKAIDLGKLDCKQAANLFNAASGAKALLNHQAATRDAATMAKPQNLAMGGTKITTMADINKANADFWKGK
jgi:hypothetical protein